MSTQEKYTILDIQGERRTVAQGMTSDAPTGLPAVKDPLKEMMCIIMCACRKLFEENKKVSAIVNDGEQQGEDALKALPETEETALAESRKLQQNCVAGLFQALDVASEYRSLVKAEVYYDMQGYRAGFHNMTDRLSGRPQPLMSRATPGKPLKWHWGVISHVGRRKNKLLSSPVFEGKGNSLRRPDVVVLRAPGFPDEPNIQMIYEMKFDEKPNRQQIQAYQRIVGGDGDRVQVIEVKDCKCEGRKERLREVSREDLMGWAAAMSAALAAAAAGKGRRPPGMEPVYVRTGLQIVASLALGALVVAALPVEVPAGVAAFIALMFGGAAAATR
jgi:hypothetical protein